MTYQGIKENITYNPEKKVINKSRLIKYTDIGITTQELNNNYNKYAEGISIKGGQNVWISGEFPRMPETLKNTNWIS